MPTQRVPRQTGIDAAKPVRYRRLPVADVSTGGGSAVVRWGPNFGTPGGDSLPQKSTLAMSNAQLAGGVAQVHTLGGTIDLKTLIGPNQVQAVRVASIGASYSGPNQIQAIRHAELALVGGVGQVQAVRHTALALSGAVGQVQALGGKALGAPIWQSLAVAASSTSGIGITLTSPSGLAVGNLMVAFVCKNQTGAVTPPSGWATIRETSQVGTLTAMVSSFSKIADAADVAAGSFAFTWTTTAAYFGSLHRITGTDPTTPVNVSSGAGASAVSPVAPTATTTVVNCLVMLACAQDSAVGLTYTAPSGYLERSDQDGLGVAGAHLLDGATDTKVQAAIAATGAQTIASSGLVATDYAAQTVCIAPGDIIF